MRTETGSRMASSKAGEAFANGGAAMTINFGLLGIVVLAVATIAMWAMWRWAPTEATYDVWCPVYKKKARIVAIQTETKLVPASAGPRIFDVKSCSLFRGQEVNCRRECLKRP
jgi:hypothetical protein